MITTLSAIDLVYQLVSSSSINTAITGGIYKSKRPLNSDLEDTVINSLPIDSLQLQEVALNLNIYVPNLVITVGGVQDFTQPNYERLKYLADLSLSVINDQWIEQGNVNVSVIYQTVIEDQESNCHYINIRLQLYAINV